MKNLVLTILTVLASAALCAPTGAADAQGVSTDPLDARIVTDDMDRFWVTLDAAKAVDESTERSRIFEQYYLDPGTPGLKEFLAKRIGSAEKLVRAIDTAPTYYASLRSRWSSASGVEEPVRTAFGELEALYSQAVFPDVYILIGRLNAGGTIGKSGLLIGFEMHGAAANAPMDELNDWHRQVLRTPDALPYIIAHELIHFQQTWSEEPTLLEAVFLEGSADFIAELISGKHINAHVHAWGMPREDEIWRHFSTRMQGKDYTGFLYGGSDGKGPEGWPQDVGYFLGYRIAQSYYEQVADKRKAIAEMLTTDDFEGLLRQSGYASRFK